MGWPRRRRQQQQQLRRRAAKDYLLACCSAAIDMCGSVMGATTTTAPTHQYCPTAASSKHSDLPAKTSTATWRHTASPHKPKQKQHVSTGQRRHRGLREKLYSVDSLAETEPEDNDDLDDDDETASESGDLSPLHHHHVHHSSASKLQIEPVIPEETPVVTKSLLHDDSEDLVETDDEDEDSYPSKASPAATESSDETLEEESETPEPAAAATELLVLESKPEAATTTTGSIVDGDETASEDEATTLDAVISNCSVTVEEVASTSVDLFGQEITSPSASQKSESETSESETSEKSESETKHAPFLFPPPYFPGDVDEYESDIYETLLRREKVHHVESDYFGFQPHVTIVMRAMLLDWLVEVHNHFNLQPETLYLTVNYIDRFLATVPIKRENFQLVALTALLIASKFEEVHPVDIEDLVYICERSYTAQQIVQFEKQMLAALKFNLVVPTCSGFLDYYTDKLSSELVVAQLANFFCEQTLLDFHLNAKYVPSVVASSALLLAQCYVEKRRPDLTWVLAFEETTGYYAKDIWCCVHDLSDMLVSLSFDLVAVRTKYRSSRFGGVSDMPHVNVSAMAIE